MNSPIPSEEDLGGSLEEAIFHAILEAAERDSFLLAWYARLPLRQLDLGSSEDPELRLMTERVRSVPKWEPGVPGKQK